MATHTIISFDKDHTMHNNRTYVHATYSSITNRLFHPHLTTLPIRSVNICENLLYQTKLADDVGSATTSSYINSSEHYDNAYTHTYDNPFEYVENVS